RLIVASCVGCRRFDFSFSSRRRHTRFSRDWSSDVCSSDLVVLAQKLPHLLHGHIALEIQVHVLEQVTDQLFHQRPPSASGAPIRYTRPLNGRASRLRSFGEVSQALRMTRAFDSPRGCGAGAKGSEAAIVAPPPAAQLAWRPVPNQPPFRPTRDAEMRPTRGGFPRSRRAVLRPGP